MTRMAALLLAAALALTGCTGSDSPGPDEPIPGSPSPGAAQGGEDDNQPPPEVEPSPLPPGESTSVTIEVVGEETEPAEGIARPAVILVRNERAGRAAAEAAPAAGAADVLRSWDRYGERALLVVYGGAQPDAGHAVRVDDVSITRGGRHLAVFGAIVKGEGAAAQVVSIPWVALSIDAGAVALARKCFLTFEGQNTVEAAC